VLAPFGAVVAATGQLAFQVCDAGFVSDACGQVQCDACGVGQFVGSYQQQQQQQVELSAADYVGVCSVNKSSSSDTATVDGVVLSAFDIAPVPADPTALLPDSFWVDTVQDGLLRALVDVLRQRVNVRFDGLAHSDVTVAVQLNYSAVERRVHLRLGLVVATESVATLRSALTDDNDGDLASALRDEVNARAVLDSWRIQGDVELGPADDAVLVVTPGRMRPQQLVFGSLQCQACGSVSHF
jgi:hypothetical protein